MLTLLPHKRCVRVADSGWPLPKVELVLPVGGADELVTGRSGIQAAPNIVTENVISPDNTHAAMGHLGLRTMDRMESIPSCGHNGGVNPNPTNILKVQKTMMPAPLEAFGGTQNYPTC